MDKGKDEISRKALTAAVSAIGSYFLDEADIGDTEKFAEVAHEYRDLANLIAYQLENADIFQADLSDRLASSSQENSLAFYASLSGGRVSES